jgi:predicted enzyme related to lactoylglutathione lyase
MVGCDTIIIFTSRMVELAEFYRRGLDLPEPQAHGSSHLGFRLDNLYFGFDQIDDGSAGSVGVTMWFAVSDLDAAFERFVGAGAQIRYPPTLKPMGDVLASLRDLDQNVFGLVQR